ncbi:MAG: hypothetical protein P8Z49_02795 [Acidobacteriota bacterium]
MKWSLTKAGEQPSDIKEKIFSALKSRPINEGGPTLEEKYGIDVFGGLGSQEFHLALCLRAVLLLRGDGHQPDQPL